MSRRHLDLARHPEEVQAHDIVILHRVVCCYPDFDLLLQAAADHATRLLVFSHPPRNLVSRFALNVMVAVLISGSPDGLPSIVIDCTFQAPSSGPTAHAAPVAVCPVMPAAG